jgi:glycopeptide antibiotics resistance protein
MQIVIRRPVTVVLLLVVTAMIIGLTLTLKGKSYSKVDPIPFEDLRHLVHRLEHRPVSTQIFAVIVMPVVANLVLFVPWGFLMFISLYTVDRPTIQTYVLTILLGLTFTVTVEAVQYFLPDRVADVNDIILNTAGTLLGALLGHARLRLRFEFQ